MASIRKRTWAPEGAEKTAWVADYFDQSGKRHIKTFAMKKAADASLVTTRGEAADRVHPPANTNITAAGTNDRSRRRTAGPAVDRLADRPGKRRVAGQGQPGARASRPEPYEGSGAGGAGDPLRAPTARRDDPPRHQEARPLRPGRPPHHRRSHRPEQQPRHRLGVRPCLY